MSQSKTMLDFEKLLRVPYVNPETGFEISPDGRTAAFSWNGSGRWEIYLLDLEAGSAPRQIAGGTGAKFCPRFSPDGKRLLFALDADGSESFDIYLCELASGEQINLTPDSPESIQPSLCWSPDGRQIGFISDRSGRFCTYVMEIDDSTGKPQPGEPRLVFSGPGPNSEVCWSPDGEWLAVVAESRAQDTVIGLIPVGDRSFAGEARLLSLDEKTLNAWQARWSPDSKRLAFSANLRGRFEIGIFERESGEITWITSGPGDKGEPDWSPDGRSLAYIHSDGPDTWLAILGLENSKAVHYQVEPGMHYKPHFTPDGKAVLFVFDSPRRPDDLWLFDLGEKKLKQLTNSMPPDLSPEDFIMPEHVHYPSLDGCMVPALLYRPPGVVGRAPAVVVIHGGPSWLFSFLWYPVMSHMASRGWIVLAPNYRGSTGYGQEWQIANRFEMGRGDTMDVAAGVDFLIREGLADPDRIAVSGRSHGGFLTMSCMTEYPELWAAGSAVVPFLNWFTSHANSRQDLKHWDIENMGDPVQNEAMWRERSPFFFLERVSAPIQLICGANDPRCPASESIAARDRLLALDKEVDFLLYPDEGHAFLKIENVIDHELQRVEFLAKRLES